MKTQLSSNNSVVVDHTTPPRPNTEAVGVAHAPRPYPTRLSLTRRIETGDTRLHLVSAEGRVNPLLVPPDQQTGGVLPLPAETNEVQITVHASFNSLATGVAECNWGRHGGQLLQLFRKVAQHEAVGYVSECLAYNLLSGNWARDIRGQANALRIAAEFKSGDVGGTVTVKDALAWPCWPVSTPAQTAAGTPDPKEVKAANLAPLTAAIRDALSGRAGPTTVRVVGVFTLAKGTRSNSCHAGSNGNAPGFWLTAESIRNSLRTFDRFHGDKASDRVIAIEPDGLGHRAPAQTFLPILNRAMDNLEGLSSEELYFLIGVLVRGGSFNAR